MSLTSSINDIYKSKEEELLSLDKRNRRCDVTHKKGSSTKSDIILRKNRTLMHSAAALLLQVYGFTWKITGVSFF